MASPNRWLACSPLRLGVRVTGLRPGQPRARDAAAHRGSAGGGSRSAAQGRRTVGGRVPGQGRAPDSRAAFVGHCSPGPATAAGVGTGGSDARKLWRELCVRCGGEHRSVRPPTCPSRLPVGHPPDGGHPPPYDGVRALAVALIIAVRSVGTRLTVGTVDAGTRTRRTMTMVPPPPGGESGNRERVPAGAGRGGADGGRRGGPGTGGGRAAATARRAGGREGRHGRGGRTDRVRLPGGVPVAARGRRGRTAAARGRGDRRRQDQHVRAGTVAVHGGAGLRGHPESLAPGPTPPAVPRVVRRQPWPPGSCRPPWARTAPGRCASPPPGRTSSASSHSAAASRPDRTRSPSRASPSTAPSPARSPTPPASWTRPAETTRATCTGRPPSTPPRPSEESRGGSESPCP